VKAAPFAYVRPAGLDDALAELADGEGKVLAGGQSLVPVLAMRLARPATLVDINAVEGLDTLRKADGHVLVGATVRQQRLERDPVVSSVPLVSLALPWVGHRELRSRGTVCGSLAHADPAAELPAVASCLNAQIEITGQQGVRTESARDFFTGPMTTSVGPDEVLTGVRFPVARPDEGFAFAEIARRHGDFALAGVAVRVRATPEKVSEAVLTAFGISDQPRTRDVTDVLAQAVQQAQPSALQEALTESLTALAEELVDTAGDVHGSRAYRKRLLVVLGTRELANAHGRALAGPRKDGS
jgi:2-furoyl-CoA dehydrogenase FAD binding subunit